MDIEFSHNGVLKDVSISVTSNASVDVTEVAKKSVTVQVFRDGLSAYEIAVINGYTGTFEDFGVGLSEALQRVEGVESIFYSKYESAEDVNSYTPVAVIDNKVYKFDSSNINHLFAFAGFSITSSLSSEQITIQDRGIITLNGWGLEAGKQYLAGSLGTLVKSTSNELFRKVIGFAINENTLKIIKDNNPIKIN